MKLIQIDGLDRDTIADILILDKLSDYQALILLAAYTKCFGSNFVSFKVVPEDYRLCRGMEDLV